MSLSGAARFILALAIGTLGGWLFWMLRTPLPWLLGSMLACGIAAIASVPIFTPARVRPLVTALLGSMLGTSFGAHTFANAGAWLIPICGLFLFVAAGGSISYLYFRRVGGLDRASAFFSAMPGGLVEMISLGAERGGDERLIALVHAARIFLVVLFLPFLIQFVLGIPLVRPAANSVPLSAMDVYDVLWLAATAAIGIGLGKLVRLPARHMFGPLIVSALVHFFELTDFTLPTVLVSAAQIAIGTIIGCRFAGTSPALILRVLALSVGATALLLGVTFAFAVAAARLSGESLSTILLAYSPGGLAEMSLVALALNGEVALVVLLHAIRVGIVVMTAAAVFRLLMRKVDAGSPR